MVLSLRYMVVSDSNRVSCSKLNVSAQRKEQLGGQKRKNSHQQLARLKSLFQTSIMLNEIPITFKVYCDYSLDKYFKDRIDRNLSLLLIHGQSQQLRNSQTICNENVPTHYTNLSECARRTTKFEQGTREQDRYKILPLPTKPNK